MRISYRETARIAESMAHLLEAGIATDRIFDILGRHGRSRSARDALEQVRRNVEQGRRFSDGFRARARAWPPYFVELVHCSERAGLLYAGFSEGADHFRKMAKVHRAAHMLWMGPVAIVATGWVIRGLLRAYFVGIGSCISFYVDRILFALPFMLVIMLLIHVRLLRRLMDALVLHLPLIAETVRDLSLYQFTTCFRFLYMGAISAPEMVRLAGEAVGNTHLSRRLRAAAVEIEEGSGFAESLGPRIIWPPDYINSLSQAEASGQLDAVLERLARERKEALETRVEAVRKFVEPAVTYVIVLAIVMELLGLVGSYRPAGLSMARPGGLEPPTIGFVGRYSVRLSYGRGSCGNSCNVQYIPRRRALQAGGGGTLLAARPLCGAIVDARKGAGCVEETANGQPALAEASPSRTRARRAFPFPARRLSVA